MIPGRSCAFCLTTIETAQKRRKKREKKRKKKESTACYFDKEGDQGINHCRIRSARKISIVGTWRVLLSTLSITRDQRDIESSLKRLFIKTGFFVALHRREDESRIG